MVKRGAPAARRYLVNAGLAVLAIDYRTVGSSEDELRCQWFPERQVEEHARGRISGGGGGRCRARE